MPVNPLVLRKLSVAAESHLGHMVRRAVITVPAYFNDKQHPGPKHTGQIARLEVAQFINEPTAVVLAYGLDNKSNSKTVVYHLGAGTFDCSIITVTDGVFEVLSTNGDAPSECNGQDKVLKNHVESSGGAYQRRVDRSVQSRRRKLIRDCR